MKNAKFLSSAFYILGPPSPWPPAALGSARLAWRPAAAGSGLLSHWPSGRTAPTFTFTMMVPPPLNSPRQPVQCQGPGLGDRRGTSQNVSAAWPFAP